MHKQIAEVAGWTWIDFTFPDSPPACAIDNEGEQRLWVDDPLLLDDVVAACRAVGLSEIAFFWRGDRCYAQVAVEPCIYVMGDSDPATALAKALLEYIK